MDNAPRPLDGLILIAIATFGAIGMFYLLTTPEPAHAPDGLFDVGEVAP